MEPPKPRAARWIYRWDSRDVRPDGGVEGWLTLDPDQAAEPAAFNVREAQCEIMRMQGRNGNECHGRMAKKPPPNPCPRQRPHGGGGGICLTCLVWAGTACAPPAGLPPRPHARRLEDLKGLEGGSKGTGLEAWRLLNHLGLVSFELRCQGEAAAVWRYL